MLEWFAFDLFVLDASNILVFESLCLRVPRIPDPLGYDCLLQYIKIAWRS